MTRPSRILIVLTLVTLMSAGALSAGDTPQKASKNSSKKDAAVPVESTTPKEITWLPFDSGLAKAKVENKAIVADFYTTWCGWCKRMDATTFRDSGVVAFFNKNFIGVRVNGDNAGNFLTYEGEKMTERQLTQTLGVRGYPTYWFFDSEGKKIGPAPGYMPANSFMLLLKYVGENHYKTMSYDSYMKQENGKG